MAMAVTYSNFCGRIISEHRNGVTKSYVRDTLGNTVALLDDTHTATDTWTYWPYGEVASRTGTTTTPFQFVGTLGYYVGSLSLTYERARVSDSGLARFLTASHLAQYSWANPYIYGNSNPVGHSDPVAAGFDYSEIDKMVSQRIFSEPGERYAYLEELLSAATAQAPVKCSWQTWISMSCTVGMELNCELKLAGCCCENIECWKWPFTCAGEHCVCVNEF